ncbi:MAG: DUF4835 family protein [bacterium]|nr:DUF4835 family protein [Candidatus Kapabacteria bacterium]
MLVKFSTLATIVLVLACTASPVLAQEIEATVAVNSDQLSSLLREEVAGFADDMKRYVDDMRWTDYQWDGEKIKMNFNVVFTGYENGELKAKLLVGSQRAIEKSEGGSPMMKVFDESWTFPYSRNQPFQRDYNRYDELTGLIDFYVYVAIGLDLDSYELYRGVPMHAKAREVMQRAQSRSSGGAWTTQVQSGVYSRYGLVKELTDIRYNPFRQFIYNYHYNGLDLLAKNRAVALDSVDTFLTELVVTKNKIVEGSTLLRVLTDAKHVEWSELFAGYADETVWRKLTYLDPSHTTVYEAARNRP